MCSSLTGFGGFVQSELPGAGAVPTTSRITVSCQWQKITGDLIAGNRLNGFKACDGSNAQLSISFRFLFKDVAVLQVFQEIVACPTLTDLTLRLEIDWIVPTSPFRSVYVALVPQVFSVLRTSRSLSTLNITFLGGPSDYVESFAGFLSENSSLRSCTVTFHSSGPLWTHLPGCGHPLQTIVGPFTTTWQSGANVGIKGLVLNYHIGKCDACSLAIVDLVAHNTTLEKLEMGTQIPYPNFQLNLARGMGRALGCNQTLKEIRFLQCSVAEFKELVIPLVPDAIGRQANTTLSTLKLSLSPCANSVLDYMTEVATLVESNSTLMHVGVSQDHSNYNVFDLDRFKTKEYKQSRIQERMVLISKLRGKLEQMLNNELRRNTSLQSLTVGGWKLLRVGNGHEWQMTYVGPCLARQFGECDAKSYHVKVKLR